MSTESDQNPRMPEAATYLPPSELKITHPMLLGSYTALDIAKIAAGCTGSSPEHQIHAAIELLVYAENAAMTTPRNLLGLCHPKDDPNTPAIRKKFNRIHDDQKHLMQRFAHKNLIAGILRSCERDNNGRIKRNTLIAQCLKAVGRVDTIKNIESTYKRFLEREDVPDREDWRNQILSVQTGSRAKVFITEHDAEIFAVRLVGWLKDAKLRSKNKDEQS